MAEHTNRRPHYEQLSSFCHPPFSERSISLRSPFVIAHAKREHWVPVLVRFDVLIDDVYVQIVLTVIERFSLVVVSVGGQVVAYGLSKTWILLAPLADRGNRNQVSTQLAKNNRLPRPEIFGNEVPFAVLIGVILAVIVSLALSRTVWGFKLRMLGRNPRAAQRSGVAQTRYGAGALMLSGGFAGLAGAAMLAGGGFAFGNYQLVPGFATNIGWTGLLVALVAREKALVAIPVAFVFAGLRTGSSFVGATGVEGRITDVIQGLLVLALLIPPAVMFIRDRKRAEALATDRV